MEKSQRKKVHVRRALTPTSIRWCIRPGTAETGRPTAGRPERRVPDRSGRLRPAGRHAGHSFQAGQGSHWRRPGHFRHSAGLRWEDAGPADPRPSSVSLGRCRNAQECHSRMPRATYRFGIRWHVAATTPGLRAARKALWPPIQTPHKQAVMNTNGGSGDAAARHQALRSMQAMGRPCGTARGTQISFASRCAAARETGPAKSIRNRSSEPPLFSAGSTSAP